MAYSSTLRGERFTFPDLRDLFAKANEEKSGDQLAGIAAASERQRIAAKFALADVTLAEIAAQPLIDPDRDDVSRLILQSQDREAFAAWQHLTVGQLREWLVGDEWTEAGLRSLQRAVTPEMAAAVGKLMSNKDLVCAAS